MAGCYVNPPYMRLSFMHAQNFVLDDYLNRIGFSGDRTPNARTLTAIMRCQLFTVPFENLDVQAGKVVSLVPEDIVDKIVYQQRGGYCYEVNGLLAMALTALGFGYTIVGARSMFYPTRRPRTHMVLVVNADDQLWLCDTGFGSFGLRAPLSLGEIDKTIQQDDDFFRLRKNNDEYTMQALVEGEWASQYGFDLYPHELIDFIPANFYNSKHPDAIFVQKLVVIKHNPKGRHILLGNRLKIVEQGQTTVADLSGAEVNALLQTAFGLTVHE